MHGQRDQYVDFACGWSEYVRRYPEEDGVLNTYRLRLVSSYSGARSKGKVRKQRLVVMFVLEVIAIKSNLEGALHEMQSHSLLPLQSITTQSQPEPNDPSIPSPLEKT